MKNEEKYKLAFNYLNKLIERKKSTKTYLSYNNNGCFGFQEFTVDGYNSVVEFRVSKEYISISFQDGSCVSIKMTSDQMIEIRYLFNKIVNISEENGIERLISTINL